MWSRVRLDIGWSDLGRGYLRSYSRRDRVAAQEQLETFWSEGRGDALACLSVRSGLDLLLRALELPSGAEVLYSAVNIPDMWRIAELHRLIPVPVDIGSAGEFIDVDALRDAVTEKSRMLVVAPLFGGRPELHAVLAVARESNLFVVEDCAQAWCDRRWRGTEAANVSLFSFGPIKTATALGGALSRVSDPAILSRMRHLQTAQPVQEIRAYRNRICQHAFLKAISPRPVFAGIARFGRWRGKSIDETLGGMTRGFSPGDLLDQLRRQPCIALLNLLESRLRQYDQRRVERRIRHARRIIANLELAASHPELQDHPHSFWLFPLRTDRPAELIRHLQTHGFDATQRGRLEVLPPPADRPQLCCPRAHAMLDRTLFLPCYPEMTNHAIDRMCEVIREFSR